MADDKYQGHDYYLIDELLTDEHKLIRETVRTWVKQNVSPIIEEYAQKAEFPRHLLAGLGEIGAFGPYIPAEYGGPGLDQISYGIIMQELERCDSGLRSTASVQSSLVMFPIWSYATESQKQKWLPKLATGEYLGCFGAVLDKSPWPQANIWYGCHAARRQRTSLDSRCWPDMASC